MMVFLDTGILGILSSPNEKVEVQQCQEWLYRLLARGVYVISSDICDYEVRRGLLLDSIRKPSAKGIDNLNKLQGIIEFLPLTQAVMRKASELWAISQSEGIPTADPKTIDADVIIAAQCQLIQSENPGQSLTVATINVKHLSRFVDAQNWQQINF